ncbi:MAG: hypothetical protein GX790_04360 [Syntrophomonadaceae bacterium]|nr:hypothetical protein [Syntrophomonadaceae bacterium]
MRLRISGNEEIILTDENNEFKQGQAYTVNAVGLIGDNPPIQLVSYRDQIPFFEPQAKKDIKEKVIANDNLKIVFRYE